MGYLQTFSHSQVGFSFCYLVGTDWKENKNNCFASIIHNWAENSTVILESFYLSTEKLILLSQHIMQTSKYPFIEKDKLPNKWQVSDLLLLTTLISEQILRNSFEKTAPFLNYAGGLHFLQALLRSIINRGAWNTDMCLFLRVELLGPLPGPRTTTADSADWRP